MCPPQDAQEFFLLLMNTINDHDREEAVALAAEEARKQRVHQALAAPPTLGPGTTPQRWLGRLVSLMPPVELRNPFEGQQAACYQCRVCHFK